MAEELRLASRLDLATLVEIERESFGDPWSRWSLAALLDDPLARCLVAIDGAGYASLRVLAGEAELLRVAVRPPRRGRGLGGRLVARALVLAAESGADRVFLEVRADNPQAVALYRRLGFQALGVRRAYYAGGVDAVVMRAGGGTPAPS